MSIEMLPTELTQYLRTQIPLTQAMAVTVASIEANAVALQAPLAPNINHRHSVFGGSAAALCPVERMEPAAALFAGEFVATRE